MGLRKRPPSQLSRKPASDRERKIQAALQAAMRLARGNEPDVEPQVQNRVMELALAAVGIAARKQQPGVVDGAVVPDNQPTKQPQQNTPRQSSHRKRSKTQPTKAEAERARLARERKRERRKAARAAKGSILRQAAIQSAAEERQKREKERRAAIERFISAVEEASFSELIAAWRKHVELVRYIEITGKKREHLELYSHLVRAVEGEWHRRSWLRHSDEQYFDWPTTEAKRGNGGLGDASWVTEGVLGYLGYAVGESSTITASQRHAILRRVFQMHLPPIESPSYMAEWDKPGSAPRLRKMANSIASFARQAKRRRNADMREAVTSWEVDLRMLYDEYYVGKFGFGWPSV